MRRDSDRLLDEDSFSLILDTMMLPKDRRALRDAKEKEDASPLDGNAPAGGYNAAPDSI